MKYFYGILLMFLSLTVFSQRGGFNVTGSVIDEDSKSIIEYATVSFYSLPDSTFITGSVTDLEGKFQLKLDPGRYFARLQFVSYSEKVVPEINVPQNGQLDMGNIPLSVSTQELDAVTVQAERTQMQLSLDKKVFNIGKDLSNLAGSASDILDNLPSVEVDLEGNVSLRGSQNVRILIDGKPSGLVGLSSADALRQLQSDLIESVEVITNPSARYDAEGMAGVINIILKKEKRRGLNGSFQANSGYPDNHGGSVNVNYRSNAVNWFTNIGARYRQSPGGGSSYQEFFLEDTTFSTRRNQDRVRGGFGYNARFGADFYLGDKNTITTSFLYRFDDEENESDLTYDDYSSTDELISRILRAEREMENDENLEYSVNYTRSFNNEDQKLTFDVQYQENNETESANINQIGIGEFEEDDLELTQRTVNAEGESRLLVQSDYIQPLGANGKVEVGFRVNSRRISNDYLVEEGNDAGEFDILTNFTNDFRYDEDVYAGYGIYSNEFNSLSYQLGVRYERTEISTLLKQTDESNEQLYNNLFPSVNLTYKLNDVNALQGSYSKRISRPRFWHLNPFFSFADARNIRTGNPNLQPEFTDSYEFGLLQNLNSSTLYYAVYYRYTEGVEQRVSTVDEFGTTFSIPQNLSRSDAIGLEVNANHELLDWWAINGNFNVFYREITPPNDRPDLYAEAFSFTTRVSNQLKINKRSNAQVNFFYRAPQETSQGRRLSMYSLDLGYAIDVLNNNGTISLSLRDTFNTRKYRGETFGPTWYSESEFQWRARQFRVSFIYRLNQKKQRSRGDREDGGGFEEDGF